MVLEPLQKPARSFPALLSAVIQIKNQYEHQFNLDCVLMEVAGANALRWPLRGRGSRRESAVAQLSTLGIIIRLRKNSSHILLAMSLFLLASQLFRVFIGIPLPARI
jgi:hypothetical protein